MTQRLDLAVSRNETWQPTIEYCYVGGPLALLGARIAIQWRLYEAAAGSALIDLPAVEFSDMATPTAAQPELRTLSLFPTASWPMLEALPSGLNQPELDEADRFSWDAVIIYADGVRERIIYGFAYLPKGVTR